MTFAGDLRDRKNGVSRECSSGGDDLDPRLHGDATPPNPTTEGGTIFKFRSGQREFFRGVDRRRMCALVARRQYGKTTIFAALALKKMMKRRNHTVVFGSAKLNLAREIVRKEAEVMQRAIEGLARQRAQDRLTIYDAQTGKRPDRLSVDDFAELFEAQRMEFRFWHTNSTYSRTKVVALRPDTVGETGDLMCDEVGRVRNWREVWEAVEPIVASDPDFNLTLSTTPPPDDSHYSFEQLAPQVGEEFEVSPCGNWYRSELGVWVLRVDAWDAYADGVPVYDLETGAPLTPEESREKSSDRDAWDRNYGVKFVVGGTAACGIFELNSAQQRGLKSCRLFQVEDERDFNLGLEWMMDHLSSATLGLGLDLATTEKETSNPSSFTVMERHGVTFQGLCSFVWKTAAPELAMSRIVRLVEAICARPEGGAPKRLCVDASNERYFAGLVARALARLVTVQPVLGGERIERPGEEAQTMKQFLGNLLVNTLEDGRLILAPEAYLKKDFRLVKRDRGSFATDIAPDGAHGDVFDSHKLALWALEGKGSGVIESVEGIRSGGGTIGLKGLARRWRWRAALIAQMIWASGRAEGNPAVLSRFEAENAAAAMLPRFPRHLRGGLA